MSTIAENSEEPNTEEHEGEGSQQLLQSPLHARAGNGSNDPTGAQTVNPEYHRLKLLPCRRLRIMTRRLKLGAKMWERARCFHAPWENGSTRSCALRSCAPRRTMTSKCPSQRTARLFSQWVVLFVSISHVVVEILLSSVVLSWLPRIASSLFSGVA
jgi:hypothetical protein